MVIRNKDKAIIERKRKFLPAMRRNKVMKINCKTSFFSLQLSQFRDAKLYNDTNG